MKNKFEILMTVVLMLSWSHSLSAQKIVFKDPVFKKVLLNKALKIDLNNNKEIEVSEAAKVKYLDLDNKGIKNLSGINFFSRLEKLHCSRNQLDSLVIKNLPLLKEISCAESQLSYLKLKNLPALNMVVATWNNRLKSLVIDNCSAITQLSVSGNILKELNVIKFPKLEMLHAYANEITSIDLSKNPNLRGLTLKDNRLKELDIRNNGKIKYLLIDENVKYLMTQAQKDRKPPIQMVAGPIKN